MRKVLLFVVVAVVLATLLLVRSLSQPHLSMERITHEADPRSLREIAQGQVIGFSPDSLTHAWLGIPFAQPPVDQLRWRAPQAPLPWEGVLKATRFPQIAAQMANAAWGTGSEGEVIGSEDCLYLNIYAPKQALENGPLPVMLWIHGGSNREGSARFTPYMHKLAGSHDVVVVGIQYRLGALGWLYHPALGGESAEDRSGNFGTLDIIASLRWVRDNIAAFGGDPSNVTIFGESAGGRNVFAMLSSPLANGLFHKAISQSGGPIGMWTRSAAQNLVDDEPPGRWGSSSELILRLLIQDGQASDRALAKQRLADLSELEIRTFLRSRSTEQITKVAALDFEGRPIWLAQNILDGFVLPELPELPGLKRFESASTYNAVPLITGSNLNEEKLFAIRNPQLVTWRFGLVPQVNDSEAYAEAISYGSELWKATAVDMPAEVMSQAGQPVYAYRFDWQDLPQGWLIDYRTLLGAAHATEIPFVFNASAPEDALIRGTYTTANQESVELLSRAMSSYWAQFAYTGDPGRGREGTLPKWPAWQAGQPQYLIFDSHEGGGLRVGTEAFSEAAVKQRLVSSAKELSGNRSLCERYAKFFLYSPRSLLRSQDEYLEFGPDGCAEFDPRQWDNLRPIESK